MTGKKSIAPPETFTFRANAAAELAEAMAQADRGNIEARAAYSRLLVEQSRSFGDYIRERVGISHVKKAG